MKVRKFIPIFFLLFSPILQAKEKTYKASRVLQELEAEYGYYSSKPLFAKVSSDPEDVLIIQDFLFAVHELFQDPIRRSIACAEVLTKGLAYRDLTQGMRIWIPLSDSLGLPEMVEYEVEKVFDLWNGMPAFGLVPLNKACCSILLYRGTDSSLTKRGVASLLSDVDFRGPGYKTFHIARPKIHEWLFRKAAEGKSARVMGFSLGGTLTAYTAIYESGLLDESELSIAFSPAGVTKKVHRLWENVPQKPRIKMFVTENDWVSLYGNLFGEIHYLKSRSELGPHEAHVSFISSRSFTLDIPASEEITFVAESDF